MLKSTIKYLSTGEEFTGDFTADFLDTLHSNAINTSCRILNENDIIVYDGSNLNDFNLWYEGGLLKTTLKITEFVINEVVEIAKNTVFNDVQIGISNDNGNTFYYVSFGKFYVNSYEQDIVKNETKVTCYDEMSKAMVEYNSLGEAMNYTENTTNLDFLNHICGHLGITISNDFNEYPELLGLKRTIETYNEEYSYRDILDDFAEILGGCICIKNGILQFAFPIDTTEWVLATADGSIIITDSNEYIHGKGYYNQDDETNYLYIDEEQLSNVVIKNPFSQVSSLVLARSPQNDNAVLTLSEDGSTIKLDNNMLVEGQPDADTGVGNRIPYLQPILDRLVEWGEFYEVELTSYGFILFEPADKINLKITDEESNLNEYPIIWSTANIKISPALSETSESKQPDQTEGEYKLSNTTSQQEKATYLYVDKVSGEIISRVSSAEGMVSTLQQNVSSLNMSFQDLQNDLEPVATNIKFDANGVNISSSNIETNLQLNASGMSIYGSNNEELVGINGKQFSMGDWIYTQTGDSLNIYKKH